MDVCGQSVDVVLFPRQVQVFPRFTLLERLFITLDWIFADNPVTRYSSQEQLTNRQFKLIIQSSK